MTPTTVLPRHFPMAATAALAAALVVACGGEDGERQEVEPPATAVGQHESADGEHDHGASGIIHDHASGHPVRLASEARFHTAVDDSAEEIVVTVGPIRLSRGFSGGYSAHAGAEVHGHHSAASIPPVHRFEIPLDGYLVGLEVEVVDSAGRPLPKAMLHHANLMMPERRELFMPVMQRLGAASSDTRPIRLPWPLGVPVEQGEPVLLYVMMHRAGGYEGGEVHLRVRLPYHSGVLRRYAVHPFFIDVSPPPGPAGWDVPPGRSVRSWEGRPAISGRILGMGGHLHRYGRELVFENVTTGEVLLRTAPDAVDDDGRILSMPQHRFLSERGLRIDSEHLYRLTAVYENPTTDTIPMGAMGSIGGLIRPGDDWPDPDPEHPEYAEDLRILHSHETAARASAFGAAADRLSLRAH